MAQPRNGLVILDGTYAGHTISVSESLDFPLGTVVVVDLQGTHTRCAATGRNRPSRAPYAVVSIGPLPTDDFNT